MMAMDLEGEFKSGRGHDRVEERDVIDLERESRNGVEEMVMELHGDFTGEDRWWKRKTKKVFSRGMKNWKEKAIKEIES